MIELNKTYTLGKKAFWIVFMRHGKFILLLSAFLGASSYFFYYTEKGKTALTAYLLTHNSFITSDLISLGLLLGSVSFLFFAFIESSVFYRQYKFSLDNHSLKIRKGIFLIKEIVVPYHHIQNVEINTSYFLLPFGLVTLDIITNSSNTFEGAREGKAKREPLFPLMDRRLATALSRELIRRGAGNGESFSSPNQEAVRRTRKRKRN